jgi:hypothetical protein
VIHGRTVGLANLPNDSRSLRVSRAASLKVAELVGVRVIPRSVDRLGDVFPMD